MTATRPSASLREFAAIAKRASITPQQEAEIVEERKRAEKARLRAKLKESGILDVTTTEDHERFVNGSFAHTEALRTAIQWFVAARNGGPNVLVLLGHVGAGKTVAAGATLVRNHGYGVYKSIARLVRLHSSYSASHQEELDKALAAAFLIIDDVGTEAKPGEGRMVLQEFLNARQDRRYLTVITGNLTPEEFRDRYDERTWSRLQQIGRIVEVGGDDLRSKRPIRRAS